MEEAAADLRMISNDDFVEDNEEDEVCDFAASFDGTWQRRGYASPNGVVTTISIDTGKCLAYECLKACKSSEKSAIIKETMSMKIFITTTIVQSFMTTPFT